MGGLLRGLQGDTVQGDEEIPCAAEWEAQPRGGVPQVWWHTQGVGQGSTIRSGQSGGEGMMGRQKVSEEARIVEWFDRAPFYQAETVLSIVKHTISRRRKELHGD